MRRRIPRLGGGFYDTDELPTPTELAEDREPDLCVCGHERSEHYARGNCVCLAEDVVGYGHADHLAIEDDNDSRLEPCPCLRFDPIAVAA